MITALIKFRNEELFLKYAIASILPYVDNILLVNNRSTDNSREIATQFVSKTVKLIDCNLELGTHACSQADYYNWCTEQTDPATDYIFKFDGDAVVLDSIQEVIELARSSRFDLISFWGHNLFGDHRHKRKAYGGKIGGEPFIFRRNFKYTLHPDGYAVIYKNSGICHEYTGIPALHLNIKSGWHYLLREQHHYHRHSKSNRSLEEWTKQRFHNITTEINRVETELLRDIEPYTGPYPNYIIDYLQNPKWYIVYENGIPAKRIQKW